MELEIVAGVKSGSQVAGHRAQASFFWSQYLQNTLIFEMQESEWGNFVVMHAEVFL
jgi:hypothetical protein